MQIRTFIRLLFVILLNLSVVAQADECADLSQRLGGSVNQSTTRAALDQISQARLTILAESHYQHYFWKMPHIYSFLKARNPSVNCLFSEISQDASDQQIQEVINGQMNEIFYTPRRLGFGPLYEYILDIGDGLVLVDAPIGELGIKPPETEAEWLTRRDTWMLHRIDQAFASSECTGGVYNVGAAHTWDYDQEGASYVSFGTRAKQNIVGTIVIEKIYDDRLNQCMWDIPSFVAPASDPVIRGLFDLDTKKSSADYVLYLREIDIMHALTVDH